TAQPPPPRSRVQASPVREPGPPRAPARPRRTMRAAPQPLLLLALLVALLSAPAARARRAEAGRAPQPEPERPPAGPGPGNATRTAAGGGGSSNSSGDALVTRLSGLLRALPTLKAAVIVACAFTALLIACLLLRVFRRLPRPGGTGTILPHFMAGPEPREVNLLLRFMGCSSCRSGRRLKKTRKYDIITTPAERVEMAPLNEEDDEDEDATVFDIKYR
ncbi:Membrane protein FAM174B, partial [Galemys pyrenaicus]